MTHAPPARVDDRREHERAARDSLASYVRAMAGGYAGAARPPGGGRPARVDPSRSRSPSGGALAGSPVVAQRASLIRPDRHALAGTSVTELRRIARRTWHYFDTYVTEAEHHLPPDNVQETPEPVVATRTSPTNIGLYLFAVVAAADLGWIGRARHCAARADPGHRGSLPPSAAPLQLVRHPGAHRPPAGLRLHRRQRQPRRPPVALSQACSEWADASNDPRAQPGGGGRGGHCRDVCRSCADVLDEVGPPAARGARVRRPRPPPELRDGVSQIRGAGGADVVDGLLHDIETLLPASPTASRRITSPDERSSAGAAGARNGAQPPETRRLDDAEVAASPGAWRSPVQADSLASACSSASSTTGGEAALHRLPRARAPSGRELLRPPCQRGPAGQLPGGREGGRPAPPLVPAGTAADRRRPRRSAAVVVRVDVRVPHARAGDVDASDRAIRTTNYRVVRRQRVYAAGSSVPWGISESAYNARDVHLTYQYSPFGVPGLGLVRGLGDNLVVAPYATGLAAMVDPERPWPTSPTGWLGARGDHGFYEAVDFTPRRLLEGQGHAVVQCFMAHHQGMTVLGLHAVLRDGLMRDRFHRDPRVRAAELLLQERHHEESRWPEPPAGAPARVREGAPTVSEARLFPGITALAPGLHRLSGGGLPLTVTPAGGGTAPLAGPRPHPVAPGPHAPSSWARSSTCARDEETWSATPAPLPGWGQRTTRSRSPSRGVVEPEPRGLSTELTWALGSETDVAVQRLRLSNQTRAKRTVDCTSYAELVLGAARATTPPTRPSARCSCTPSTTRPSAPCSPRGSVARTPTPSCGSGRCWWSRPFPPSVRLEAPQLLAARRSSRPTGGRSWVGATTSPARCADRGALRHWARPAGRWTPSPRSAPP